ncbi:MAG: ArsR family transcriptional regulator [Sphingomonadales bacterium]|nr:MAG: ArsR family transcriptional regulator [Sphingomonadales bacterium]
MDEPASEAVAAAPETFRPLSRVAMRGLGEFLTHILAALAKRFDGDLDLGIFFVALLGQAQGATPSPISVSALSRSLARPFETARRLCNRLCDLGLAERTSKGVVISANGLEQQKTKDILGEIHGNLVRLAADLRAVGYPIPPQRGATTDRAAIESAAIDLLLVSIEFGIPPHPMKDWQRPYLYLAVMTANARPYTFDPELAMRYSDVTTPPADAHRAAVSASVLARAVGIPYSTVRRNLEAMVEEGRLIRTEDGYLTSMVWMQGRASAASGVQMATQVDRILGRMAAAGFPFDDPASAYRDGPPPFLNFH